MFRNTQLVEIGMYDENFLINEFGKLYSNAIRNAEIHARWNHLPNKETNFAFSIDEADNMKSNYVLSKNINDYNIDLKLTNNLMRPEEYDEISFNLNRKF